MGGRSAARRTGSEPNRLDRIPRTAAIAGRGRERRKRAGKRALPPTRGCRLNRHIWSPHPNRAETRGIYSKLFFSLGELCDLDHIGDQKLS
jgi:hypothetical protein